MQRDHYLRDFARMFRVLERAEARGYIECVAFVPYPRPRWQQMTDDERAALGRIHNPTRAAYLAAAKLAGIEIYLPARVT